MSGPNMEPCGIPNDNKPHASSLVTCSKKLLTFLSRC